LSIYSIFEGKSEKRKFPGVPTKFSKKKLYCTKLRKILHKIGYGETQADNKNFLASAPSIEQFVKQS